MFPERLCTIAAAVLALLLAAPGALAAGEPGPPPDEGKSAEVPPPPPADAGGAGPAEEPAGPADGKQPAPDNPETGEKKTEPLPQVIFVPVGGEKKPKERSLLVLEPRAISYKFLLERVRVGNGDLEGTKVKPERYLGMASTSFLSPEINTQLNFKILGYLARMHFSYSDTTLHGLNRLPKDIFFDGTVFPAGAVTGSQFTQRRASFRYFQEVYRSDFLTVDANAGGDYLFFRNIIDAPGLTREKDVTEAGLPVLGARGFLTVFTGAQVYGRLSGFYWNLGREAGASGILEWALGFSVNFTKNWGFMLDFSFVWISLREGRHSRVAVDYWEFGPGITIYACI